MKTQVLQALDDLPAALAAALAPVIATVRSNVGALLPDDPPPPADPTGLNVIRTYGENPLCIELGWDELEGGSVAALEDRGAPGNAAGPQEWTVVPVNGGGPSDTGVRATLILQNPEGQNILIRLITQRLADGQRSNPLQIPFPSAE